MVSLFFSSMMKDKVGKVSQLPPNCISIRMLVNGEPQELAVLDAAALAEGNLKVGRDLIVMLIGKDVVTVPSGATIADIPEKDGGVGNGVTMSRVMADGSLSRIQRIAIPRGKDSKEVDFEFSPVAGASRAKALNSVSPSLARHVVPSKKVLHLNELSVSAIHNVNSVAPNAD